MIGSVDSGTAAGSHGEGGHAGQVPARSAASIRHAEAPVDSAVLRANSDVHELRGYRGLMSQSEQADIERSGHAGEAGQPIEEERTGVAGRHGR